MNKNLLLVLGLLVFILVVGGYLLMNRGSSSIPTGNQSPTSAPSAPTEKNTAKNTVTLNSNGFSPSTLTIKKGETVTWANKSGQEATVNSDPHPTHTNYPPLNLGSFQNGTIFTLTFDKIGSYGYHNHLNPSQKGTIVVK